MNQIRMRQDWANVTYPIRIDLSMHSLQKRWRHSITVRVFLIIPVQETVMVNASSTRLIINHD